MIIQLLLLLQFDFVCWSGRNGMGRELFTCFCHRSHPSLLVAAERVIGNGKYGATKPGDDDEADDDDDDDILDNDEGNRSNVLITLFEYWSRVDDILELSVIRWRQTLNKCG